MMEVIKAIVLKTIHYSETQKIIHLFSLEKGSISMISPSIVFKRKGSPIHRMQVAEIEYFPNEKGQLHKLKTISPLINLPHLYFDIFKMNMILLWGEILSIALKNEGKNEALFDFIARSVEYLNIARQDTANFNLFFLYKLVDTLGFKIDTATWQNTYLFNISSGNFQPTNSRGCISGPNAAQMIHTLCTSSPEHLKEIPLNRSSRKVLLDIFLHYLSYHLNLDFNLKSIEVIREVFDE